MVPLSSAYSPPIFSTLIFILGLLWGSFFNVCILRLPEEKSVVWGRSSCPKCHALIPWFCNIPLISFILLRGRCRNCKAPISIQYPVIELITGFLFFGLYSYYGLSKEYLFALIFCSSLLVISVIDLKHQIIPDEISLPGIIVGFLVSLWIGKISWMDSLLGILLGGGSFLLVAWGYEKLAKREGLGGGDIKLLAMIGAWLGVQSLLIVIVISSLVGSVMGIGTMIFYKKDFKAAIPFGPFLALGALAYLFWGNELNSILFPPLAP
jgi:leader peptidase (prepilin peptidase)/N-methyltransferase